MTRRPAKFEESVRSDMRLVDVTAEESIPLAPIHRPSYPRLTIFDDRRDFGEILRIRKSSITIGRSKGDFTFPAEGFMSASHARISYQELSPKRWDWVLDDLTSRHGVFVRIQDTIMQPGMEFLIGGTKLRVQGDIVEFGIGGDERWYRVPYIGEQTPVSPWKIEVLPYLFAQKEISFNLHKKLHAIGRQGDGGESLFVDPFVEPVHLNVVRTTSKQWKIIDRQSLNGLWLRVARVILSSSTQFLIGEQRFSWESE